MAVSWEIIKIYARSFRGGFCEWFVDPDLNDFWTWIERKEFPFGRRELCGRHDIQLRSTATSKEKNFFTNNWLSIKKKSLSSKIACVNNFLLMKFPQCFEENRLFYCPVAYRRQEEPPSWLANLNVLVFLSPRNCLKRPAKFFATFSVIIS